MVQCSAGLLKVGWRPAVGVHCRALSAGGHWLQRPLSAAEVRTVAERLRMRLAQGGKLGITKMWEKLKIVKLAELG